MDTKIFLKIYGLSKNNPKLINTAKLIIKITPILIGALYFLLGIYIFIEKNPKLLQYIIVPLTAFIFTTVIRKIINRPRPFDKLEIQPYISHKSGVSFPSRHTVSSLIIALAILSINFYLGIICVIISVILGFCRILVGVHYPSDILGAFLICIIFGIFL